MIGMIEYSDLIRLAGLAHFGILIASAMVPAKLNWKEELARLSPLQRQMYWIYGAYIVLCIVAFGLISLILPEELISGDPLANAVCLLIAVFWGGRLALQPFMKVKPILGRVWWMHVGYHTLTLAFLFMTAVYGWAAWVGFNGGHL